MKALFEAAKKRPVSGRLGNDLQQFIWVMGLVPGGSRVGALLVFLGLLAPCL